jgi:hypothetical protein
MLLVVADGGWLGGLSFDSYSRLAAEHDGSSDITGAGDSRHPIR